MPINNTNIPKPKEGRSLKKIPDTKIAKRLKDLRGELTLIALAEKLQPFVSIVLEGNVGRSVISNLENRKQNLTPELAIAYSKVFDVSLEYLFCVSEHWKEENKDIKEVTGLSDKSIDVLKKYPKGDDVQPYLAIFNTLCECGSMTEIIEALDKFVFTINRSSDLITFHGERSESVDIMPIALWKLNHDISTIIDKIKDKMLSEYSYLYEK